MSDKQTTDLIVALRALLAEFRAPENRYWLTSACADRLEAVLTERSSHQMLNAQEALRRHIAAVDGRPQDGHSESGFSTCPHPDCRRWYPAGQPALVSYMTAETSEERDAAFLRTYAARVLDRTASSWEIPNTVATTLQDIASRIESRRTSGPLGEAGARLRALHSYLRHQKGCRSARPHQCAAVRICRAVTYYCQGKPGHDGDHLGGPADGGPWSSECTCGLDALLSAPVVSGREQAEREVFQIAHRGGLDDPQVHEGLQGPFTDADLKAAGQDWGDVPAAPVVTQEGEEPCP